MQKSHRRMLIMLRGGSALYRLRLANGRVYLEKRGCVESVG